MSFKLLTMFSLHSSYYWSVRWHSLCLSMFIFLSNRHLSACVFICMFLLQLSGDWRRCSAGFGENGEGIWYRWHIMLQICCWTRVTCIYHALNHVNIILMMSITFLTICSLGFPVLKFCAPKCNFLVVCWDFRIYWSIQPLTLGMLPLVINHWRTSANLASLVDGWIGCHMAC